MTFVLLILAYLLGSIPSGLWIGQIFFQTNLREHGSEILVRPILSVFWVRKQGWQLL